MLFVQRSPLFRSPFFRTVMAHAVTSSDPPPRNEKCYAFFESLGSPKFGVAPMVDASELPFRMLCRKYGATMAWTPMLHSRLFAEGAKYRAKNLTTCPEDRPLAVQFCANDPDILLKASQLVVGQCDAVDINLGCPQNIAKRGNYGAFLGEQWDIVKPLVEKLNENLSIPVIVKIRILDCPKRTIEYAKMIEAAGASILSVHGRTKEQKGHSQGLANWEMIRQIKNALSIPVISNGNIRTLEDAEECLRITGCDGVMSACGLLRNPALFSGLDIPACDIAEEYLEFAKKYPVSFHIVRSHMFKFLHNIFKGNADLRDRLGKTYTIEDTYALIADTRIREQEDKANGLSYPLKDDAEEKVKKEEKRKKEAAEIAAMNPASEMDSLFSG